MLTRTIFPVNIAQYVDVLKVTDMPFTLNLTSRKHGDVSFHGQELFLRLTERMREMWIQPYMPDIQDGFDELVCHIHRIEMDGQIVLPEGKTLLDKDIDQFLRRRLDTTDVFDQFIDRIGPVMKGEDGATLKFGDDKNIFIEMLMKAYIGRFVINVNLDSVGLSMNSNSIHFAVKFAESGSNFVSDFTEMNMDLDIVEKRINARCFDLCEYLGFDSWHLPKVVVDYHHIASTAWRSAALYKNAKILGNKFGKNIEYELTFAIYQARYPCHTTKRVLQIPPEINALTLSPHSALKYNIDAKTLKNVEVLSVRTDMRTLKRKTTSKGGDDKDNIFIGYSDNIPFGESYHEVPMDREREFRDPQDIECYTIAHHIKSVSFSDLLGALIVLKSKSVVELIVVVDLDLSEEENGEIVFDFENLFPELDVLKIAFSSRSCTGQGEYIKIKLPRDLQKFYLLGENMLFGRNRKSKITIVSHKSLSDYDTFHYPQFAIISAPILAESEKKNRMRFMSGITVGVEPVPILTEIDTAREILKAKLVKALKTIKDITTIRELESFETSFNMQGTISDAFLDKTFTNELSSSCQLTKTCKDALSHSSRPNVLRIVQGQKRGFVDGVGALTILKDVDKIQLDLLFELQAKDALPIHLIVQKAEIIVRKRPDLSEIKEEPILMRGVRRLSIFSNQQPYPRGLPINRPIGYWHIHPDVLQFPDLEIFSCFPDYRSLEIRNMVKILNDIVVMAPNLKVIRLPFTAYFTRIVLSRNTARQIVVPTTSSFLRLSPSTSRAIDRNIIWIILEQFVAGLTTQIGDLEIKIVHPFIPKHILRMVQTKFSDEKPDTLNSFPMESKCKLNITWLLAEDPFKLLD